MSGAGVVYVLASSDLGGSESALMSWLERLPALGWPTAGIWVQREGRLAESLRRRGHPVSTGSGRRFRNPLAYAADLAGLRGLLRRSRPRLVYSSGPKAHLYGGAAAALTRTPAVWFAHDYPAGSTWVRLALRLPGRVYANSAGTAAAYRDLLGWEPAFVHPPVDVDRFAFDAAARASFRARLGAADDEVLLGFIGRLQRQKGVEVFIGALAAARGSEPALRGVVVGSALQGMDEDYERELRQEAAELGLAEGELTFLPFQDDARPALSGIDGLVLTPRLPEGFGLTVIEAMAAGRRVIACAEGGPLETVTPATGELVPPGDVGAVVAAMLRLARDPAMRQAALAAGPERAREFDTGRSAAAMARAFAGAAPA